MALSTYRLTQRVPRRAGRRKAGVPVAVRGVRGCAGLCGPMGGWLDPRAGRPLVAAGGRCWLPVPSGGRAWLLDSTGCGVVHARAPARVINKA